MVTLAKCRKCGTEALATSKRMAYCPGCGSIFDPSLGLREVNGRIVRVTESHWRPGYRRHIGLMPLRRMTMWRVGYDGFWEARLLHHKWASGKVLPRAGE